MFNTWQQMFNLAWSLERVRGAWVCYLWLLVGTAWALHILVRSIKLMLCYREGLRSWLPIPNASSRHYERFVLQMGGLALVAVANLVLAMIVTSYVFNGG